ncbi:MAG TPA: MFS transporter [Caulobacteraceae bacterium]|nr:MFS transporter [Caulobacteraceae bacterium]
MDKPENSPLGVLAPPDDSRAMPPVALGEYHGRLLIVVGAFSGLVAGVMSMLIYTFGVFATELGGEYGWSRGDMSLSMSAYALVLFLGSAFIGRIADALGAGRVAAVSMLALGLSLMLLPYLVHDVASLCLAYALVTAAGLGTTPVVMIKPIVAAFAAQRGTASGIVLCGSGVGAMLTPPLVTSLIEAGGWQLGYIGLGCLAVAVAPFIWLTLSRTDAKPVGAAAATALRAKADLPGLTFREAAGRREFWILSAIAFTAAQAVSGILTHLVPFLGDLGTSTATAAGYASLLGLASLAGRLGAGFALDRLRGSLVGLLFLGGGMVGVLLLAIFGARFAAPAVILIGIALGSEIDLLAYYVSRYFGLRHHGSIFGWTYGVMSLATVFSPYVTGTLRDRQGDYGMAMAIIVAGLAIASLLCLLLGRYRYAVK